MNRPPSPDLDGDFRALPPAPRDRGVVRWICVRKSPGAHVCPERVMVSVDSGVGGDRWQSASRPDQDRQVTLIRACVAEIAGAGRIEPHASGDNFGVDFDIGEDALPVGALLRIGEAVVEISAHPHTGCRKFGDRFGADALAWVNDPMNRHLRLRGVNCRVWIGGCVAVGDVVSVDAM